MTHSIFEYAMTEYWKDIKDYEGLYQVSNLGRVKSLNYLRTGKERVLKPGKAKNGYLHICLCKKEKRKHFLIHRLVAQAFIPNPDNLPYVNHKDEDKTNNFVGRPENKFKDGNLEWCTCEYNLNYGSHNERVAKGNTNGKRSKTVLQLEKDGSLVRVWSSASEVERQLSFPQSHISACCRGKLKTAYGFKWSYIPLHAPLSDE